MCKVILEGYIVIPELDLEIVEQELASHVKLTREEAGCLKFFVAQDKEDICRFNVYEEFVNMEAFDYHQQRVKKSYWCKVTENAERHYRMHEQNSV